MPDWNELFDNATTIQELLLAESAYREWTTPDYTWDYVVQAEDGTELEDGIDYNPDTPYKAACAVESTNRKHYTLIIMV